VRPILPVVLAHKSYCGVSLCTCHLVFGVIGRFCLSCLGALSKEVSGTSDASSSPVQDVSVNHRRFHVAVAQQFLHRADVVPVGQQVRGERVAKRVTGDSLGQTGLSRGLRDGLLALSLLPSQAIPDNVRLAALVATSPVGQSNCVSKLMSSINMSSTRRELASRRRDDWSLTYAA
jgi:hypothetical protein